MNVHPLKPSFELALSFKPELSDEWVPEPLVPEDDEEPVAERIVVNKPGIRINVNGNDCINFGSYNFLSSLENSRLNEAAKTAIKKACS